MSNVTKNNTLPAEWNTTKIYNIGDTVYFLNIIYRALQRNSEKPPKLNPDIWEPLDIYKKDSTVMDHDNYSGEADFWERDNIYIDSNGFIYLNNENTGINVNGKIQKEITFQDLTEQERLSIKGDKGDKGDQGIPGPQGPEGPMGEVILTPEQIDVLKGDQGKSTYEIWLDEGHIGTESDFLNWVQSNIVILDDKLDILSEHALKNKAISSAFADYQRQVNTLLDNLTNRIIDLENRLKAIYQGTEHTFRFGITENGKYGYIIDNSDTVIPFQQTTDEMSSIGVEQINGIAYNSLGETNELTTNSLLDAGMVQTSSLTNEPSVNSILLTPNVYSTTDFNITDFDKGFKDSTYRYVYQDRILLHDYPIHFVNVNAPNIEESSEEVSFDMYNLGDTKYEGIWFGPEYEQKEVSIETYQDNYFDEFGYGHTIYITLEPYNCNSVKIITGITSSIIKQGVDDDPETIQEQKVSFKEAILNQNTMIEQNTYTITDSTTIQLDRLNPDTEYIYLSTNNTTNQFKITEIYLS